MYTINDLSNVRICYPMISFNALTSPKAPRPITLRDSKSSRPSRVRFSRRNSVSFLACWERRIRFCRDGDVQSSVTLHNYTVLYKGSGTDTCSQKHCKGFILFEVVERISQYAILLLTSSSANPS